MSYLENARTFLLDAADLSSDGLQICLGLAVMLLAVAIFRRSLADWRPLAVVALVAVAGGLWGMFDTWMHGGAPRLRIDWIQVVQTLFWPAILFVLARFTRLL